MPNPYARPDGLTQLTELMRYDAAPELPPTPPVDPARRRRLRRRRALIAGLTVLAIAAGAGGYSAWALTAPIGTATLDAEAPPVTIPAAAVVGLGGNSAAAAVSVAGADEYLGAEASGIWMSAGDGAHPIASISKIITALVVLDAKPLSGAGDPGPTIHFTAADYALYDEYYVLGASIAEMPRGSSLSLHDALEAMLVVSACNYAEAVTNWAFGSQSAFLRAARAWLDAHGLTGTTMVEPTGIDPRNTSTLSDLVAIGKLAMANPVIAEIVRMTHLDVPGIPARISTNELLGTDGITGIKTGTLEETGANLLFSATLDVGLDAPLDVVGAYLGSPGQDTIGRDVRELLASIRAGFHDVPLGTRGDEVGIYTTPWGESAEIVLGDSASLFTWSDAAITSSFTVDPLTTGSHGDQVGRITWTTATGEVTVPLKLAGDIEPPDAWWRLTHPAELGG